MIRAFSKKKSSSPGQKSLTSVESQTNFLIGYSGILGKNPNALSQESNQQSSDF